VPRTNQHTHRRGTHTFHGIVDMVYTCWKVRSVRPSNMKTGERIFTKFRIAEIW